MPRKHLNIKVTSNNFQISLLDPYYHQQFTQDWLTAERMPKLVKGLQWKECGQPLDFARALDQCVLACSSLAKHITTYHGNNIESIFAHVGRDDVTFMLQMKPPYQKTECLFRFTWDQHAQIKAPGNFSQLNALGFTTEEINTLKEVLTNASYGRLGLIARCLRLMGENPFFNAKTPTHAFSKHEHHNHPQTA